jgi:thioredoxin-like negative regulator of GroEL
MSQRSLLAKHRRAKINVERAFDRLAEHVAETQGLVKEDVKRNLKQMHEDIKRRFSQPYLH